MHDVKTLNTHLDHHMKLLVKQYHQTNKEKKIMDSSPYASGVESIMYDVVCSKLDIAYAVSIVIEFMVTPDQVHWEALKWVMRYLNGYLKSGLKYTSLTKEEDSLEVFVVSDYLGNMDTRKSLLGFMFTLFERPII